MTDISTLAAETSRLLNFYQGAESTINTKLNQVLQSEVKKRYDYYVDAENGDDANPGTEAEPFRTLNKFASILFPLRFGSNNGHYNIYLKTNQVYTLSNYTLHNNGASLNFLPYGDVTYSLYGHLRSVSNRPTIVMDGLALFNNTSGSMNFNFVNIDSTNCTHTTAWMVLRTNSKLAITSSILKTNITNRISVQSSSNYLYFSNIELTSDLLTPDNKGGYTWLYLSNDQSAFVNIVNLVRGQGYSTYTLREIIRGSTDMMVGNLKGLIESDV